MPDLIETAASPAVVWVVPKSVPAARLGKALGASIPADGSRDLIGLTAGDGKHATYPLILAEAIERVDPAATAHIRGAERDLDTSHMSVRARAVADQAWRGRRTRHADLGGHGASIRRHAPRTGCRRRSSGK